jgi:hypothetical protein
MCAGLSRAVDLHPAAGPLAGADGPRRARRRRGCCRDHRDHHHHDDPAGGAGAGGRAGSRAEPVGCLLDRDDDPHCSLHGRLPALPASRAGVRGVCDRRRAAAAGRRRRRLGSRNIMGRIVVRPLCGDAGLVSDRLWLRRIGATCVVAARAARLPVDVHEGGHHRPARDRHPDRPPGHAGSGGLRLRQQRPGSGVRRLAVPVPVHHDRVRRTVRLPFTDRLRHHAENVGEGKPDAADRLRPPSTSTICRSPATRSPQRRSSRPPETLARSRSSRAPAGRPHWRSACRKCCTRCSAVSA